MSFVPFVNFLQAPLVEPASNKDMFANILKHYQMAQEPERLARQERMGQIEEKYAEPLALAKIQEAQGRAQQYSPETRAMKEALIKAQIEREQARANLYKQGGGGSTYNAKAEREYQRAVEEFGEDSPQAMRARSFVEKTSGQRLPGPIQAQNYRRDLAAYEFDYLNKVQFPPDYRGGLGEIAAANDVANYVKTKDPNVKKKLAEAYAKWKLVNEEATLSSQMATGQTPTVDERKHQRKIIEGTYPKFTNKLMKNLPPEIVQEGEQIYINTQRGLKKTAKQFQKKFGHPESYLNDDDSEEDFNPTGEFKKALGNNAAQLSDEELLRIIGGSQ